MPCFKGFRNLASINLHLDENIFKEFIGNLLMPMLSFSRRQQQSDTPNMKQAFPLPSRAELDSAFVAIYRSDIPHIHKQTLLVLMERAKREADRKLTKLSK